MYSKKEAVGMNGTMSSLNLDRVRIRRNGIRRNGAEPSMYRRLCLEYDVD